MGAYGNYLARQMGGGISGEIGADDVGALIRFPGWRRRHHHHQQQQGGGWPSAPQGGGGGGDEGMDEAEVGDLGEVGADLERLGEEDEECEGDTPQAKAATIGNLDDKIHHLRQHIHTLQMRLDATPRSHIVRRRHLGRLLAHAREKLHGKERQRQKHARHLEQHMGIPAQGRILQRYGADYARIQDEANTEAALNKHGMVRRSPAGGTEERVAFQDVTTGSQIVNIQVAAGAGLRTANISMITPLISYAAFEVVGLDVRLNAIQGQQAAGTALAQEMLISVLLQTIVVNGGINLIYTTQNVVFGAQYAGASLSNSRTIAGLRKTPPLQRNNTASLTAVFRQEIDNTVIIDATFEAALVIRVLEDDETTG